MLFTKMLVIKNLIKKILELLKVQIYGTEIIEYPDSTETAVCNLASIGFSRFVTKPTHCLKNVTLYTKTKNVIGVY